MRHRLQVDCKSQLSPAEGIDILEDQERWWPLLYGTLVNGRLLRIFIEDNSFFLVTTPNKRRLSWFASPATSAETCKLKDSPYLVGS
jgi:hypothetical protein